MYQKRVFAKKAFPPENLWKMLLLKKFLAMPMLLESGCASALTYVEMILIYNQFYNATKIECFP